MGDEDCPICYTKFSIPIAVPVCGHKFCFCCLKGACVEKDNPLCPICRQAVDTRIFDHPTLFGLTLTISGPSGSSQDPNKTNTEKIIKKEVDDDVKPGDLQALLNAPPPAPPCSVKKFWLYYGTGGWWRFEPRDEEDIKRAVQDGEHALEITMCGHVYIVDFTQMRQYRKDNPNKKRAIKEVTETEMAQLRVYGVAGMRCG